MFRFRGQGWGAGIDTSFLKYSFCFTKIVTRIQYSFCCFSLTTSVNQLETRCADLQSTIEDLYAGNKNLANYAKIKKLSIASQAGGCDDAAGLDSLAALPRVSRCSGPSSLDAHSSLLSGPESILSLPNDAAAAAVDVGDDGLATNEKLAINKVVKYFEHRRVATILEISSISK